MCSITCLLIQEYIFNPCWPKWLEFICFNCCFILLFKHTRIYFYILLSMCWLYTVKNRVESAEKSFCWITVTHVSNLLDVTKLFSQVLDWFTFLGTEFIHSLANTWYYWTLLCWPYLMGVKWYLVLKRYATVCLSIH